jgi:hypothetical protein
VARPRLLAALLLLAACTGTKARLLRAACEAGDANACDLVAARLLLGEDGPRDETGAASFSARARDLRLQACAVAP